MSRLILTILLIAFVSVSYCQNIPIEKHKDPQPQDLTKSQENGPPIGIDLSQKKLEQKSDLKLNISAKDPEVKSDGKPNISKADEKPSDKGNEKPKANDASSDSNKNNNELKYHKKFNHNVTEMDSSTLKRLVLVLVAFSILFILYLAYKTYRKRNRRTHIMVSKYGVRTRRSDVEMRPLPLSEDEEDETVFDVGTVNH